MYDQLTTVRARHLGMELRRALEASGMSGNQLAQLAGCSPSTISRMLSGKRQPSRPFIAAFLALCGMKVSQWNALLELADDVYNPIWWHDFGTTVPTKAPPRDEIEASASTIACYGNALVPDLLRTPDYTRALLRLDLAISEEEIEDRVTKTARRQEILEGRVAPELRGVIDVPIRPKLEVYLDERVLTCTGAGDDIMSDQAHHLLRMALRPDIHIHVIHDSCSVGAPKPFTLLRFPAFPPVVYLEHSTVVAYLEIRPQSPPTTRPGAR